MTTTSFRMNRQSLAQILLAVLTTVIVFSSCKKPDLPANQVSKYSSEVLDKWMTLQLRLMRNSTGIPNHAQSRQFAYTGIAAVQSIAPGLPSHSQWASKWNGLTGLPVPSNAFNFYHFPSNVNAAMASMNRAMFPNAVVADKLAIDSLEAALNQEFLSDVSQEVINRSANFGKAVATAVFNWSETDGYKNANAPYVLPTGPGKWVPTTPNTTALTPYWGDNRTVIKGSLANTSPAAPIPYSTHPGSQFYKMNKHIYDVSLTLTDNQKAMAIFWRDVPGVSSPGHWLSILQQVVRKFHSRLDKAALAYALTGAAINDGVIACWKTKYQHNLLRPITYIRDVMGYTSWNTFIGTPPHPDYTSGHSVLSGAAAATLKELFGNSGSFTDHTYDYMGLPARTYNSFSEIAVEAGMSRVYAGIHYKPAVDIGLVQGRKIVNNIFSRGNTTSTTAVDHYTGKDDEVK